MLEEIQLNAKRKLPVVLQSEATECGLASLAMITSYYGNNTGLNDLRQKFSISLMGATLDSLMEIASKLNLGARAIKVPFEKIDKLQVPAILHWDMNHFVVLKHVGRSMAVIHDPARGRLKITLSELSSHFTGVALELTPTTKFKKNTTSQSLKIRELWTNLVGFKTAIIHIFILSIIIQIILLASPFYLQLVMDEVVVKNDADFLLTLAIGFGALAVINVATTFMRSWSILYYGHQLSFQLILNIFNHLIHLKTDYFEKRHVGDIISRMNSTNPIQLALTQGLVTALIDGLMATITGVVIFIYSPILGFIVLFSVFLLIATTLIFYPLIRAREEKVILAEANKETHLIESIKASTTIKIFTAQNHRVSIWRNLFVKAINAKLSHGKYEISLRSWHELINSLQMVLIIYFGVGLILSDNSTFTVGMLFAFMAYRLSFTQSITSLMDKFVEFKLLSLHLSRISDIVHSEAEYLNSDLPSLELAQAEAPTIEFRNVSFRYSDNDPWVIKNVSLFINSGEFVAITGRSGGGKTTVLKLALGLYSPTSGQILLDGTPLTSENCLHWREMCGVVMQDDQLLSGSIAENISFFDQNIDMENVRNSAVNALIHNEIIDFPMKYSSLIGDMGSILSGGQKQRILLARAFYRNPKTLFLDEGTANIDQKTEKLIVEIIESIPITRVIVAHRPEFLKRAHRVISISEGKALEVK